MGSSGEGERMLGELATKPPGILCFCAVLLIASLRSTGGAQNTGGTGLAGDNRADPLALLKHVGQRYANATVYHIEAVTEEQMNADFSKNWSKSIITAIVAPGNKYRFEAHTNWEWWDLVSDGK